MKSGAMTRLLLRVLLVVFLSHSAAAARLRMPTLDGRGRRGQPPPTQPQPLGTNTTQIYSALRRDIIFLERLTALFFRTASHALAWLQQALVRSITPRVICVTLNGVIAADEDVRMAAEYSLAGRPELLSSGVGGLSRLEHGLQPDARGGEPNLINLKSCDRLLTKAFAAHGARAVVLLINSPGGSPAQSSLIYQRLRALRKRHKNVPLLCFVEDAAVSGGYYIAVRA